MRKQESLTEHLDWPLFGALITMLLMGFATVYSVAYNEEAPSIFNFSEKYGRQLFWIVFSLFLGLLVFLIDSDIYRKFAIHQRITFGTKNQILTSSWACTIR